MGDHNQATSNSRVRKVRLSLCSVIVGVAVICLSCLQIKSSLNLATSHHHAEDDAEAPSSLQSRSRQAATNDDNMNYTNHTLSRAILPEALLPVTFPDCCKTHKSAWRAVCLTERACNDPAYPFSTLRDAEYYQKWNLTAAESRHRKQVCTRAKHSNPPPTRWCSSEKLPTDWEYPTGCSRASMAEGSGPYDRLLLFPQGKLMFCGIPKVGITQWIQFLRFTYGAKDYQTAPYNKMDVGFGYFDNMRPHVRNEVWNNPSWTKAVFIRNPAERLLSAYLDKIEGSRKYILRENVTFAEFVDLIAMKNITNMGSVSSSSTGMCTGLSWRTDPHWRPQAWACGLSDALDTFHYVATMDRVDFHTRELLKRVDMWESFGKHYRISDTPKGKRSARWPPEPLAPGEEAPGFQQRQQQQGGRVVNTTVSTHHKGSSSKLEKYYTPELMKKVRELYWMDFALWDALQEGDEEGIVHGKHVAAKLNPKCQT